MRAPPSRRLSRAARFIATSRRSTSGAGPATKSRLLASASPAACATAFAHPLVTTDRLRRRRGVRHQSQLLAGFERGRELHRVDPGQRYHLPAFLRVEQA